VFTIPNLLTMARALGIPVFLYLVLVREEMGLAILTLVIAGATDYFDGKLARAWNQESRLGELMDPAVDRLYIISVLIAMFATQVVDCRQRYPARHSSNSDEIKGNSAF
jgi:cardiolipin synthase